MQSKITIAAIALALWAGNVTASTTDLSNQDPCGQRTKNYSVAAVNNDTRPQLSESNLLYAQYHHGSLLPIGNHHYYEHDLEAMVSYSRCGNNMLGALYKNNKVVCFAVSIEPEGAEVRWWGDVGYFFSGSRSPLDKTYNIDDFTVGNGQIRSGWHNPSAVRRCTEL